MRKSLLILSMINSIVFANEEAITGVYDWKKSLKELSTISSNLPEDRFSSSSTVYIISKDEIEKYNYLSIADALSHVPGFNISRTYFKQDIPTSRGVLQNNYSNKVLFMIENIATWNSVSGESIINRIDISQVKRIEILKGPASVKYGTNSYSGVVNILLNDSYQQQMNFSIGAHGSHQYGVQFTKNQLDSGRYFKIFASSNQLHGTTYDFKDEKGVYKRVRDSNLSNNLTLIARSKRRSFLFNFYEGKESFLGLIPNVNFGIGMPHNNKGYLMNYSEKWQLSDKSNLSYKGSYDYNRRDYSQNTLNTKRTKLSGYRIDQNLLWNYQVNSNWNFETGYSNDFRKSTLRTYGSQATLPPNLEDKSIRESSVFSQLTYQNNKFKALLGSRKTFNELFGSNLSNRISLVYQLDEDKSLKFFAGESYRSPSILELYLKTVRNLLFGNLNLLPAVSRSYEISYLQKKDNVFFQVSSFLSSYTNKISRVKKTGIIDSLGGFFAGTSNVYSNVSKFNSEGFELEVKFKHPKNRGISSFINYSYICGDDGDRDAQGQYNFKFVPKHNFSLGLDTGLTERLLLSILVKYVDDTNDFQGNIIKETSILDLNLIYNNPTNGSRHAFSIKNLFNQEVYIPDYTRLGTNGGQFTQVRNPISNQQIIYSYQWNF